MLTLVTCPTCHHKFTVPEGRMGHRSTCPNCQAVFVAGKSIAESNGDSNGLSRRGLLERAADEDRSPPPLDKTMLGEVGVPVRYNCPRCKKPLESPASEAGTKKPCPSCGGRLQVPAAPPRPALDSGLNKTLLATAEGGTPYQAPVAAAPAPQMPPTPSPAAAEPQSKSRTGPLAGWRKYAVGGLAAAAVLLAVLYFVGKHNAAIEQEKWMQAQKLELDKLKAEIDQKTALLQQQEQLESRRRHEWEEMVAKQEARQRELDRERERDRELQKLLTDKKQAQEAQTKIEQKQRELDEEKKRAAEQQARAEREMKEKIDDLKRQVQNANNKTTTVITQPPPPVYPWWGGWGYGRYYPW